MKNLAKIGGFGFKNWGVGGFRGAIFTPQMGGLGVPHPNPDSDPFNQIRQSLTQVHTETQKKR